MAQVGSLYTSMTLESASFVSNMKKVVDSTERGAAGIERALGGAKTAVAGFIAAISIDQVVGVVNRGLDYAASLGELSQQLGVTTRDLQVFRYAATQVGISQETMDKSLAKLTRTLGEAKTGSESAVGAFQAVGISQQDIARLDTGEAIRRIAEGLAKIEDPAKRAAAEVDLFGRAGQQLDTLLAGGRGAIDELAGAADRLGVVLSDDAIQRADETADKLAAVKTVLEANIARTVADNADAILLLADAMAQAGSSAGNAITKISDFFRGTAAVREKEGFFSALGQQITNPGGLVARGALIRQGLDDPMANWDITRGTGIVRPTRTGANDNPPPRRTGSGGGRRSIASGTRTRQLSPAEQRMEGIADPGVLQGVELQLSNIDNLATTTLDTLVDMDKIAGQLDASKFANAMEEASRWGDKLTANLAQAIVYGQNFGAAVVNSLQAIAAEMVASGLKQLLLGSDGQGGIVGSIVGAVIGGKRAAGGPVQPGLAYVVGERGPELFSPSSAGTIIPNGAAMSGGVVVNFNGPVSNGRQVRLAASQAAARLARAAGAGRRGL